MEGSRSAGDLGSERYLLSVDGAWLDGSLPSGGSPSRRKILLSENGLSFGMGPWYEEAIPIGMCLLSEKGPPLEEVGLSE